jgi:hypothetical protein
LILPGALVGLGGRYDMTLGTLATTFALRRLLGRDLRPATGDRGSDELM